MTNADRQFAPIISIKLASIYGSVAFFFFFNKQNRLKKHENCPYCRAGLSRKDLEEKKTLNKKEEHSAE